MSNSVGECKVGEVKTRYILVLCIVVLFDFLVSFFLFFLVCTYDSFVIYYANPVCVHILPDGIVPRADLPAGRAVMGEGALTHPGL